MPAREMKKKNRKTKDKKEYPMKTIKMKNMLTVASRIADFCWFFHLIRLHTIEGMIEMAMVPSGEK